MDAHVELTGWTPKEFDRRTEHREDALAHVGANLFEGALEPGEADRVLRVAQLGSGRGRASERGESRRKKAQHANVKSSAAVDVFANLHMLLSRLGRVGRGHGPAIASATRAMLPPPCGPLQRLARPLCASPTGEPAASTPPLTTGAAQGRDVDAAVER